jgi:Na+/H+ antiporter NhaD/arsenite permease-like protein
MFPLAIAVLLVVYFLIALQRMVSLRIWQIMLLGALAVLISGQISAINAIKAINPDIMLFLFGMFVIGQAVDQSGYLAHISHNLFRNAETVERLVLIILFGGALASAFLMKDSLVIIATPLVLLHADRRHIPVKPLLLALAFGVTIGSVMSPIGNPQNMLIAVEGNIHNPFVTFFSYLAVPTLINLAFAFLLLKLFYGKAFERNDVRLPEEQLKDPALARLAKISLAILLALSALEIALSSANAGFELSPAYISLIAAIPIVIFSPKRLKILKRIDWQTLVFFAAMFTLMESVWETGLFQSLISGSDLAISSLASIFSTSVVVSQFISNIPLVALYLPILLGAKASTKALMALAAGSTVAGNFFILGAASNVIILQLAEDRGEKPISFLEFAKIGVPLTIINIAVYWLYLSLA